MASLSAELDPRIYDSLLFIEERFGDRTGITALAAKARLSPRHFKRLFTAEIGQAPADYIRTVKLHAALLRLRWSDDDGMEISDGIGYSSRAAFVRAFTRAYGISPARYRAKYRNEAASTQESGSPASVQDLDGFRIVSKRYIGKLSGVADWWQEFLSVVPGKYLRDGKNVYIGQLYNDPRTGDNSRYDCGLVIETTLPVDEQELRNLGLRTKVTRAGRYCSHFHSGPPHLIADSYDTLLDRKIARKYRITDDPALEIHHTPRHLQPVERREFAILIPVD